MVFAVYIFLTKTLFYQPLWTETDFIFMENKPFFNFSTLF